MKIQLKCTYSGNPKKHGEPGDVIDLPKDEAERLIGLGAAIAAKEAESKVDDSAAKAEQRLAALKKAAEAGNVDISAATTAEEIEAALSAAGVALPQA
ncbi:hypothetical protein ACFPOB_26155 [Bosea eneae]|uniref:Mu-like prophage FluMu N-terminal domain-containing protein n=1 Tax=Bosea eneae TaxID=151454 RepID=A0ABW0IZC2_9HYPH